MMPPREPITKTNLIAACIGARVDPTQIKKKVVAQICQFESSDGVTSEITEPIEAIKVTLAYIYEVEYKGKTIRVTVPNNELTLKEERELVKQVQQIL